MLLRIEEDIVYLSDCIPIPTKSDKRTTLINSDNRGVRKEFSIYECGVTCSGSDVNDLFRVCIGMNLLNVFLDDVLLKEVVLVARCIVYANVLDSIRFWNFFFVAKFSFLDTTHFFFLPFR